MGVPTTRALCLVASGSQYTRRMWYEDDMRRATRQTRWSSSAAPSHAARHPRSFAWAIRAPGRVASRGVEGAAAELLNLVEHA